MIRRAPRPNRFTVLDNRCIEDERLSWGARGILHYLLSKPDDWEVNVAHLVDKSPMGRDGTYALLKELKGARYITMERLADGSVQYTVYDYPAPIEAQSGNAGTGVDEAQSGKAQSGKAQSGYSRRIVNTDKAPSTDKATKDGKGNTRTRVKFDPTAVSLPDCVPVDLWLKWCKARSQIGKRLTELAVEGQLEKLARWHAEGHDINAVLRNSIDNGYQGLVEPRGAGLSLFGQSRAAAPPPPAPDKPGKTLAELDL